MTTSKGSMTIPANFKEQPEIVEKFVDEKTASENTDQSKQCYYVQCNQGCVGPKQSYAEANQLARDHMNLYSGHTAGVLGPTYC